MKYKLWKIFSPLLIFGLSALLHNVYKWCPSFLTSILTPVNESIWEHNKIIIDAFFIWMILDKLLFKKGKNYFYNVLSATLCSILVMLIFTPVFFIILKKQDNLILTLIIYFVCIVISQILYYYLESKKNNSKFKTIGIILWILLFIINAYFTYYPLKNGLFYDYSNNHYGVTSL